MYTAARPPTPALCYDQEQAESGDVFSDFTEIKEDVRENNGDITDIGKTVCNNGKILIGRWGRCKTASSRTDPPEVIVNQAMLHIRAPKPSLHIPPQSCKRTKFRKEAKRSEKKKQKEELKREETAMESEDGRLIASKVLPIMAMLLQRNDKDDSDEEEKKKTESPPTNSHTKPKLSVQCIQLLPSEPVTSRRH